MVFDSSPTVAMSRADKFLSQNIELRRRSMTPGAGAYESAGGIGPQTLSQNRSVSAFSFGGSTRDQASNVFISSRHEKSQLMRHSPGAGSYETGTTFQRQSLSKSINAPTATFGKSQKLGQKKSEVPGPGSYYAW